LGGAEISVLSRGITAARILVVLLAVAAAAACAPVTIVESPWKADAAWGVDQHRRMAERLEAWIDAAEPVGSVADVAQRCELPGVVLVGESHDAPESAKRLVRLLLDRGNVELWEEGIIWTQGSGVSRLQGLYSRAWRDGPRRRIIAGGSSFNLAFAELVREGLPERLVVYAGNAHIVHTKEMDGAEPRTGGPLPADVAAAAGATVTAVAVYPRTNLVGYADLNMAVSILASVSAGRLDAAGAVEEAAWCEEALDRAWEAMGRRGDFVTGVGPGRWIACIGGGRSPWRMRTVAAVKRVLSDGRVRELVEAGAEIALVQRAVNNGVVGRAYEEFVFEVLPPGRAAVEVVVTGTGDVRVRSAR
jgi:hypothetical protein